MTTIYESEVKLLENWVRRGYGVYCFDDGEWVPVLRVERGKYPSEQEIAACGFSSRVGKRYRIGSQPFNTPEQDEAAVEQERKEAKFARNFGMTPEEFLMPGTYTR